MDRGGGDACEVDVGFHSSAKDTYFSAPSLREMDEDEAERARSRLVERLRETGYLHSAKVADAVATVPRHEFVPEGKCDRAYDDEPLRIGRGQVVTAPHLVARMSELLELSADPSVLEVGTGSGYHAAVLAELAGPEAVITLERFPDLAERARDALAGAGYGDVSIVVGDGSRGLPCLDPVDRINVTAVAPEVPDPLLEQLADGGRMVIPLGPREGSHELVTVTKRDGRTERTRYGGVRFVPLVGDHGFDPEG